MTMLASWKLDPYTAMRLNSGRRGDDVLKGGHWRAVAINRLQYYQYQNYSIIMSVIFKELM